METKAEWFYLGVLVGLAIAAVVLLAVR